MDQSMMQPAQKDQVGERGRSSVGPVSNVVGIAPYLRTVAAVVLGGGGVVTLGQPGVPLVSVERAPEPVLFPTSQLIVRSRK
jgi:hypothetical protein